MAVKVHAACRVAALLFLFVMIGSRPAGTAFAGQCEHGGAKVVSIQGEVQCREAGETHWRDANPDDAICPGDMIRVMGNSRAALLFDNGSLVRLDQNTTITLAAQEDPNTSGVDFFSGIALFFSRHPYSLRIFTPFVNAESEGTEFLVQVGKAETFLSVFEGRVSASNRTGVLSVSGGQSAAAREGEPPALKTVVRPGDAVRWALYYPPIPVGEIGDFTAEPEASAAALRRSVEAYRRGKLAEAFDILQNVRTDIPSPALHSYRALLLLAVGRVDEAQSELEVAVAINPRYAYAAALRAVIALTRNRSEEALALAEKAVALDSSSPAAFIALSYVQQARFDLDAALSSAQRAADLDPSDGLNWARVAELWLSKGYLGKAMEAAREAEAKSPDLARTQTVLGYAYLMQIDIDASKRAFQKAIRLDQADPLPRLGLGLALIRGGGLAEGRTQIEIAAVLDPDNSLVRSYLGKAYYEEKRDAKAAAEFARAKELDPLDPTPWLYDAILKDTVNRPVEALADLQKSIELNDNRAVYRSRFLLDQDIAARSTSLGRIYNDLGFRQRALTEGWKSLSIDPSNYSAHRLLADSYAALPRHEIARVSELLQSQLLQPININPIQPHLAEPRLFFLQGTGPVDPAFNEYNALFNRNRFALLGTGIAGERGTLGGELVQSAVIGKASYSVGYFHDQENGIRQNDGLTEDIFNTFVQVSLDYRTSVQAEYRRSSIDLGDRAVRFDLSNFSPYLGQNEDLAAYRFGFHHIFTPGSEIIGSFIHSDQDLTTWDRLFQLPISLNFTGSSETTGDVGEIQHIFRSDNFRLVTGGGYLDSGVLSTNRLTGRILSSIVVSDERLTNGNVYLYSQIDFPACVTWTIGAAGNFLKNTFENRNTFEPKLGVMWNPFPSTVVRAAGFRRVQRPLLTGQTIEPVQIAGFNQFFDDQRYVGTDSWREGVGIDQKFSDTLFGGVEYSRREIEVHSTAAMVDSATGDTATFAIRPDWNEDIVRSYLYWAFHPRFTASLEFQYEHLEREELTPDAFESITTYRVPFGIGFFHPTGFFARIRPSFVYQEGRFSRVNNNNVFTPGDDTFVSLDASVGVLLPHRWGVVSMEARNLFDESFNFQDTDPSNPTLSPRRFIVVRYTLSF